MSEATRITLTRKSVPWTVSTSLCPPLYEAPYDSCLCFEVGGMLCMGPKCMLPSFCNGGNVLCFVGSHGRHQHGGRTSGFTRSWRSQVVQLRAHGEGRRRTANLFYRTMTGMPAWHRRSQAPGWGGSVAATGSRGGTEGRLDGRRIRCCCYRAVTRMPALHRR